MRLLGIGSLFITLAILFNSVEISTQSGNVGRHLNIPERAPSYVVENHAIRLTGASLGGEIVEVDGYFLGTRENGQFHPVNPRNIRSILKIDENRFVSVSEQFRTTLLVRHAAQSGRLDLHHHNLDLSLGSLRYDRNGGAGRSRN